MAWHRFHETPDGVTCGQCSIEVDVDAQAGFFAACPVPRCGMGDGDDVCVFTLTPDGGVACHFCGRPGGKR